MPKVSFILPAYNPPTLKLRRTGRRFLHEAIASILAQTYRDFELVVVDDCSPEDLKSVVDEFHDERLSYHRNEKNIGGTNLVAAWNHAMEYARGEWCVLASDDDVYLPQCLEELMNLQAKYPKCDLFHARNADIDAEGKWTDISFARPEFESQIELTYARSVLRFQQRMPDFMFRRAAWKKTGFVEFPIAIYSDDATWMLLSENGCVHSRDVLFCFRNSGVNLSSPRDDLVQAKVRAGREYLRWLARFVETLQPQNDAEKFLAKELLMRSERNVSDMENRMINEISNTRLWWHCIKALSVSAERRRAFVYERFPKLRALRILLPHF